MTSRERPQNIQAVVRTGLCTACGVCQNVCPNDAIAVERRGAEYHTVVDAARCKPCGLCATVCPGRQADAVAGSGQLFPTAQHHQMLGRFAACYSGHSSDPDIRFHAASGGMVTGLLSWMLATAEIDGAVVTRFRPSAALEPEAFIARTPAEIYDARSSKYCPVTFAGVLRRLIQTPGVYAVAGLPCHVHALRKWAARNPVIKSRVKWLFGIFCSGGRTFNARDYLIWRAGADPQRVRSFAFRDGGCLGSMRISTADGHELRRAYIDYYPSIRSFFIPRRCTLCHDQCAELADISFGDLHIPEFWHDTIGVSSVIARSDAAVDLLERAQRAGVVCIDPLDPALVVKSQGPALRRKKRDLHVRLRLFKLLGKAVPEYATTAAKLRRLERLAALRAAVILYLEIAIGRHRRLWWIVRLLEPRGRRAGQPSDHSRCFSYASESGS